jgi:ribonuclease HI
MRSIHVKKGDSQLVVKQVAAEYQVIDAKQQPYTKRALELFAEFDEIQIDHVPRRANVEANTMAQLASSLRSDN